MEPNTTRAPDLPANIVVLGAVYWSGSTTQRPQHLHRQLSRYFSVFYVEKPRNLLSVFFPRRVRIWSHYSDFVRVLREVSKNLFVITATYLLPYKRTGKFVSRFVFFERIDLWILAWYLKLILRRRGITEYILWLEDMKWTPFLDYLDPSLVVYDRMDNREAFPYSEAVRRDIRAKEAQIDARADVTLFPSRMLMERSANPVRYLLNNSTDFRHFASVPYRSANPTLRPQVGYIGSIKEWLDLDLLLFLATSLPEFDFVLVGRVDETTEMTKVKRLGQEPNVRLIGQTDFADLPALLEQFLVTIIPYKMNDFARMIDPCKLYEYLAAGKPVVSSPLCDIDRFGKWVSVVRTPDEWIAALRKGVAENDPDLAAERREIACQNSWDVRVEKLVQFLGTPEILSRVRRKGPGETGRR